MREQCLPIQGDLGEGATMEVDVEAIFMYLVLGVHNLLPAAPQWSPMLKERLQAMDLSRSPSLDVQKVATAALRATT